MPARVPLPEPLLGGAFLVGDARAHGLGGRLRGGPRLRAPRGGGRAHDRTRAPALAVLPLLGDGGRLSHTTGAEIIGVPLPRIAEGLLHVTAGGGRAAPRSRGVIGHSDDGRGLAFAGGIPISRPAELFIELASILNHDDLVAVGDHLIHVPRVAERWRPFARIEALVAACEEPGRRHIRAARSALGDVRSGVASRRETHLRLAILHAGLPEPTPDLRVFDVLGRPIGWFDLGYEQWRVLVEYDGEQHRTSAQQYERDQRRFELATEAGWLTIRVRKHGLSPGPGRTDTLTRLERALRSRGWTP